MGACLIGGHFHCKRSTGCRKWQKYLLPPALGSYFKAGYRVWTFLMSLDLCFIKHTRLMGRNARKTNIEASERLVHTIYTRGGAEAGTVWKPEYTFRRGLLVNLLWQIYTVRAFLMSFFVLSRKAWKLNCTYRHVGLRTVIGCSRICLARITPSAMDFVYIFCSRL